MRRLSVANAIVFLLLIMAALQISLAPANAQTGFDATIFISANPSGTTMTLTWPTPTAGDATTVYTVNRTDPDNSVHTHNTSAGQTVWTDPDAIVDGSKYTYTVSGGGASGRIYAGGNIPAVTTSRGTVVLISEKTMDGSDGSNPAMLARVQRLKADLVADGWNVVYDANHSVARDPDMNASGVPADIPPALPGDSVKAIKDLIFADYAKHPDLKAVILLGHVSVPYSGVVAPDGHTGHVGAWPSDIYYGDGVASTDASWTDTSANNTSGSESRHFNVPNDGKFDQSSAPHTIKFAVGRIDLSTMSTFTQSEQYLLANYLDKDHGYRHGVLSALPEGRISSPIFAAGTSGVQMAWQDIGSILGGSAVSSAEPFGTSGTNYNIFKDMQNGSYTWMWGDGPGSYTSAGGIGQTSDFITYDPHTFFTMLFGSYFGDYMGPNDFMRAVLASKTYGLTCFWGNRPAWMMFHTGLGEPIGVDVTKSMDMDRSSWMGFLGDPTLRSFVVLPPSGPIAVTDGVDPNTANITWTASADTAVSTYNIYRGTSVDGPFTFMTSVVGNSFQDTSANGGTFFYLIRSLKKLTVNSGSYWEQSQGALAAYSPSYAPPTVNLISPFYVSTTYTHSIDFPAGAPVYAPFDANVMATAAASAGHYLTNVSLYVNGALLKSFDNPESVTGVNVASLIKNGPLYSYPRYKSTDGVDDTALLALPAGTYTFSASATDETGTVVTSNAANLYVIDGGATPGYLQGNGAYILHSIFDDGLVSPYAKVQVTGNTANIITSDSGTYTPPGQTTPVYYKVHDPATGAVTGTTVASGSSISVTATDPNKVSARGTTSELILLRPVFDTSHMWPSTLTMFLNGGLLGGQHLSIYAPITGAGAQLIKDIPSLAANKWTKVEVAIPGVTGPGYNGINFDGIRIVEDTKSAAYGAGATGPTWYIDDIDFMTSSLLHGERPPTVDMHLPVDGQVVNYSPTKTIQISADVAEQDGKVQHVDFIDLTNILNPATGLLEPHYVLIGSSDTPGVTFSGSTYTYNWTIPGAAPTVPVTHSIFVRGQSSLATTTVSGPRTVTIQPIGNLTLNLVDGSTVPANLPITSAVTVSMVSSPLTDKGALTDANADAKTIDTRLWNNVGALLNYTYSIDGRANAYGDINGRNIVTGILNPQMAANSNTSYTIPLYEYAELKVNVAKKLTPASTAVAVTAADKVSVQLSNPVPVAPTATPAPITANDLGVADFLSVAPATTYDVTASGLLSNWIWKATPADTTTTAAWNGVSSKNITVYPAATAIIQIVDNTPGHSVVTLPAALNIVLRNNTWNATLPASSTVSVSVPVAGTSAGTLVLSGATSIDTAELTNNSFHVDGMLVGGIVVPLAAFPTTHFTIAQGNTQTIQIVVHAVGTVNVALTATQDTPTTPLFAGADVHISTGGSIIDTRTGVTDTTIPPFSDLATGSDYTITVDDNGWYYQDPSAMPVIITALPSGTTLSTVNMVPYGSLTVPVNNADTGTGVADADGITVTLSPAPGLPTNPAATSAGSATFAKITATTPGIDYTATANVSAASWFTSPPTVVATAKLHTAVTAPAITVTPAATLGVQFVDTTVAHNPIVTPSIAVKLISTNWSPLTYTIASTGTPAPQQVRTKTYTLDLSDALNNSYRVGVVTAIINGTPTVLTSASNYSFTLAQGDVCTLQMEMTIVGTVSVSLTDNMDTPTHPLAFGATVHLSTGGTIIQTLTNVTDTTIPPFVDLTLGLDYVVTVDDNGWYYQDPSGMPVTLLSLAPGVTPATVNMIPYGTLKVPIIDADTSGPVADAGGISVTLAPSPGLATNPSATSAGTATFDHVTADVPGILYTASAAGPAASWFPNASTVSATATLHNTVSTASLTMTPAASLAVQFVDTTPAHAQMTTPAIAVKVNSTTWSPLSYTITTTGAPVSQQVRTKVYTLDLSDAVANSYKVGVVTAIINGVPTVLTSASSYSFTLAQGDVCTIQVELTLVGTLKVTLQDLLDSPTTLIPPGATVSISPADAAPQSGITSSASFINLTVGTEYTVTVADNGYYYQDPAGIPVKATIPLTGGLTNVSVDMIPYGTLKVPVLDADTSKPVADAGGINVTLAPSPGIATNPKATSAGTATFDHVTANIPGILYTASADGPAASWFPNPSTVSATATLHTTVTTASLTMTPAASLGVQFVDTTPLHAQMTTPSISVKLNSTTWSPLSYTITSTGAPVPQQVRTKVYTLDLSDAATKFYKVGVVTAVINGVPTILKSVGNYAFTLKQGDVCTIQVELTLVGTLRVTLQDLLDSPTTLNLPGATISLSPADAVAQTGITGSADFTNLTVGTQYTITVDGTMASYHQDSSKGVIKRTIPLTGGLVAATVDMIPHTTVKIPVINSDTGAAVPDTAGVKVTLTPDPGAPGNGLATSAGTATFAQITAAVAGTAYTATAAGPASAWFTPSATANFTATWNTPLTLATPISLDPAATMTVKLIDGVTLAPINDPIKVGLISTNHSYLKLVTVNGSISQKLRTGDYTVDVSDAINYSYQLAAPLTATTMVQGATTVVTIKLYKIGTLTVTTRDSITNALIGGVKVTLNAKAPQVALTGTTDNTVGGPSYGKVVFGSYPASGVYANLQYTIDADATAIAGYTTATGTVTVLPGATTTSLTILINPLGTLQVNVIDKVLGTGLGGAVSVKVSGKAVTAGVADLASQTVPVGSSATYKNVTATTYNVSVDTKGTGYATPATQSVAIPVGTTAKSITFAIVPLGTLAVKLVDAVTGKAITGGVTIDGTATFDGTALPAGTNTSGTFTYSNILANTTYSLNVDGTAGYYSSKTAYTTGLVPLAGTVTETINLIPITTLKIKYFDGSNTKNVIDGTVSPIAVSGTSNTSSLPGGPYNLPATNQDANGIVTYSNIPAGVTYTITSDGSAVAYTSKTTQFTPVQGPTQALNVVLNPLARIAVNLIDSVTGKPVTDSILVSATTTTSGQISVGPLNSATGTPIGTVLFGKDGDTANPITAGTSYTIVLNCGSTGYVAPSPSVVVIPAYGKTKLTTTQTISLTPQASFSVAIIDAATSLAITAPLDVTATSSAGSTTVKTVNGIAQFTGMLASSTVYTISVLVPNTGDTAGYVAPAPSTLTLVRGTNGTKTIALTPVAALTVTVLDSVTHKPITSGVNVSGIDTTGKYTLPATSVNASGIVSFANVSPGYYTISAIDSAKKYKTATGPVNLVRGAQGTLILSLVPVATLNVKVNGLTGSSTVAVTAVSSTTTLGPLSTDTTGALTFTNVPIDTYTVTVDGSANSYQASAAQTVTLAAGDTKLLTFTAVASGKVILFVQDATSKAAISTTGVSASAQLKTGGAITGPIPVAADGTITFPSLPTGIYNITVNATSAGYKNATIAATVSHGATLTLTAPLTALPGSITGKVLKVDGSAIAGASVVLSASGAAVKTATTASDGSYTFANLVPGAYSVSASATGYKTSAATTLTVAPNGTGTATFNLAVADTSATGLISGTVTISNAGQSDDGKAIAGASLVISKSGVPAFTATTDSLGKYTVASVPVGTYTIAVSASGFITANALTPVIVTSGATTPASFSLKKVTSTTPVHVFSQAGLQMISVPYDYSSSGMTLSQELSGYASPKMAVYLPSAGAYAVTPAAPADQLRLGTGYWIRFPNTVNLMPGGTTAPTNVPFSIALKAGWNMIGDPFLTAFKISKIKVQVGSGTPVSWTAAVAANTVSSHLYSYVNSGNYYAMWTVGAAGAADPTLDPYVGYWIYAGSDCYLSLDPTL
ncbi:MAG TPA: carboxypeptidase regulatory-like domain-containing protein [Capsulimonadaceae bacterium]|jgi:hypothetical protein